MDNGNLDRESNRHPFVIIIGAGPAGLFAAQQLAAQGARVAILNRDIRPGGLAEYGIYYDKYRVKETLRQQFRKILASPEVSYYGNVTVGQDGDLTLDELRSLGAQAIVVAVGAQGTKALGLPGEDLKGVYHAKDIIYHYNQLPPYGQQAFPIGRRVALIGVGNVMADLAHWLIRDIKVDEVLAVARRGPAEVKFARQEMEYIAHNLDVAAFNAEIDRVADRVRAVNQDPEAARSFILSAISDRAAPATSDTQLRFRFLSSPRCILGDDGGHVVGLEVDDTELVLRPDGDTKAQRLGTTHILDVDTVIFCIGDRVSDRLGLPMKNGEYAKAPQPLFSPAECSYEAFDPQTGQSLEGVFVVGWAREASKGQVAMARKDALGCVTALMAYLNSVASPYDAEAAQARLAARLEQLGKPVITREAWARVEQVEQAEGQRRGSVGFRFASNAEMLAAAQTTEGPEAS